MRTKRPKIKRPKRKRDQIVMKPRSKRPKRKREQKVCDSLHFVVYYI